MSRLSMSSRILGIAFLVQFITSFVSGVFVKSALIVPGDISETMLRIAANPALMQLHLLAFCFGAILFYFLLYRSRVVPAWLSLWGLITVFPLLIATLMTIFGYEYPVILALPYIPFEFVIGIWILVKGVQEGAGSRLPLQVEPRAVGS